jgi:phospholipid transport system transporter-binding protein
MDSQGFRIEGQHLRFTGAVDLASVPALHAACLPLAGAAGLTVDFSSAGAIDSSALALLIDLRRAVEQAGGAFIVEHAPQSLKTLAALYGVGFLVDNSKPNV